MLYLTNLLISILYKIARKFDNLRGRDHKQGEQCLFYMYQDFNVIRLSKALRQYEKD